MGMSENDSEHRYKFMVSGDSISKGVIFDEEKSKYVILEGNYINLLKSKFNGIIQNTASFGNTEEMIVIFIGMKFPIILMQTTNPRRILMPLKTNSRRL